MIPLRLAKYKDGKFLRFLELGKGFGYFGDYIYVDPNHVTEKEYQFNYFFPYEMSNGDCEEYYAPLYFKDEKDPLNRFNGLFDGRTYGDGEFVLVFDKYGRWTDDIFFLEAFKRHVFIRACDGLTSRIKETGKSNHETRWYNHVLDKLVGNLHENPELFQKVKDVPHEKLSLTVNPN